MGSGSSNTGGRTDRTGVTRLPRVVDWLVGAVVALIGLALLVAGSAIGFFVDRDLIADSVAEGTVQSDVLSEGDLVEIAVSAVTWTGIGLLATGAALLVGAVAYVVVRRRAHRGRASGESVRSDLWVNATVGAVVGLLMSFVPFSPVIGGGVAGYLERSDSRQTVRVGALSGVLMIAPVVAVLAFVLAGLVFGALAIQEGGLALFLSVALFLALSLLAVVGATFGALGGFVGGKLAADGSGV